MEFSNWGEFSYSGLMCRRPVGVGVENTSKIDVYLYITSLPVIAVEDEFVMRVSR